MEDAQGTEWMLSPSSRADMSARERTAASYLEHRVQLYAFLVHQGLNPAVAQDLTQDVFVTMYSTLNSGKEIIAEKAWLYRVAARMAVDYWRREGRSMWVELDAVPGMADAVAEGKPLPDETAQQEQKLRRVGHAMTLLPKEQRMAIQLRMQGLRYRETADNLNVSTYNAADWLTTAVERLRRSAE